MGILSVFLLFIGFGWILGPIAWALDSRDLKAMKDGEMDPGGEGLTHAWWLCGMIVLSWLAVPLGTPPLEGNRDLISSGLQSPWT
jgi:hypothetical protein